MEAGGGLLGSFESSLQYVSAQVNSIYISFQYGYTNIPYMLPVVATFTGRGLWPLVLRAFAREMALEQLQMGAP